MNIEHTKSWLDSRDYQIGLTKIRRLKSNMGRIQVDLVLRVFPTTEDVIVDLKLSLIEEKLRK